MYFYHFNIEGYRKYTGHLSYLEHGIYRSLIDSYYTHEQPLNPDVKSLMRVHSIRTDEEKEAFTEILKEFFIETKEGFRHLQCDEALNEIYQKSDKASKSANIRWARKRLAEELAKKQQSDPEVNSMEKLPLFEEIEGNNANAYEKDANALNGDANACKAHNKTMLPNTYNLEGIDQEKNTVSFEDFWKTFKSEYGKKGSKEKAESQFNKIDLPIQQTLLDIVIKQIQEKKQERSENKFSENFPHVERWLKHKRWNDEIVSDNKIDREYLA